MNIIKNLRIQEILMMLIAFVFITNTPAISKDKHPDKKTAKAIVIDVRTQQEYDAGHIEGAELIPYDQIKDKIAGLVSDKNAEIILYCRSGRRSGIATDILKKIGYMNVENYGSMQNAQKLLKEKD